jgi:hypothetical protein
MNRNIRIQTTDGQTVEIDPYHLGKSATPEQLGEVLSSAMNSFINDPERPTQVYAAMHSTILANCLRGILEACRKRKGDGRIPEWAQRDDLYVPFV